MAIYRTIQLSFWTDNKVVDDFTPEDKYFYLYLFTNPQTNLCGCYEVSLKTMSDQTGYTKETIERLLDRFENVHQVIKYSKRTKEVLLLNWFKYNWQGGKQKIGIGNEIENVKDDTFRAKLINLYSQKFDEEYTPCKGLVYPLQATVTVTDTDNNNLSNSNKGINNIDKVMGMYSEICVSYPKAKSVSDARRKAINARLKTYSLDDFKEMFTKAEASDFLKGKNDKNWSATLDWLLKDSNFAKVLDGNYDNKKGNGNVRGNSSRRDDECTEDYTIPYKFYD